MPSTLLLVGAVLARLAAAATCVEKTQVPPEGWRRLSEAPDGTRPLQMSIALRLPRVDGLASTLASSSSKHLSLDEVTSMRAADGEDCDAVLRWLADEGITDSKADEGWVHVRTTAARAEALLGMRLRSYSFRGNAPVLRTTDYSVPDHLAEAITFVHPISNFMTPAHKVAASRPVTRRSLTGAVEICGLTTTPACIARRYGLNYTTPDGKSSVRLGVAGFLEQYANFADTQSFLLETKPELAGRNFSVELVNGGRNPQDAAEAGAEANLDVQYAMAVGYPAAVTYYSTHGRGVKLDDEGNALPKERDDNEPYLGLFEYLLAKPDDELPSVLSVSYADDELSVPKPYAGRVCDLAGLLAARGMSIVVGSGDGGAKGGRNSTCRTNDGSARDVAMATFPATCPWVTAVGAVTHGHDPPRGAHFSTGGFSQYFKRPAWQDDAVTGYVEELHGHLAGHYDAGMRAIPDISVVGTSFKVIVGGQTLAMDGTSASTPVFAAMIALVNDARLRKGKPSLGWLNKKLYSPAVRDVLHDATTGLSKSCTFSGGKMPGGWPAKKGWDAITGLGTPGKFDDLLRVLVDL
ncbi:hypothetical protein RJ55_02195 [Drechmeria coniospora]|nr:hypothetical protein RJ55_02195 [Drechmeria coniospora]